jgi:hypothetical protein
MPKTKTSPPETDDDDSVDTVEIPFRGANFVIPKNLDDWEIEACLAIGSKQYASAAKIILGAGQWAMLQALGSKRRDINEFLLVFGRVVQEECVG